MRELEVVLIFAGGEPPSDDVIEELPRGDLVIGADSGYDQAVALGYPVDVLVGDLDSLRATDIPQHVLVETHPADKDATDLELALELTMRDPPERVVVVGGSGGRVDHELGTATLLASNRWVGIDELDWVTNRARAHVIRGRRILHGDVGSTVSLIPLGGDAVGVSTTGLRWDLHEETLRHAATRGISNVMRSPIADIRLDEGCLLAVFPRDSAAETV